MKVMVVEATGQGKLCHYTVGLCNALGQVGVDTLLVSNKAFELDNIKKNFRLKGLFNGSNVYSSYYPKLLKLVADERPDVIHIQWFPAAISGYLLLGLLRAVSSAKIVYTAHNILPHEKRALYHGVYKKIYQMIDKIIAPSKFNRAAIMEMFDLESTRISVIPDCLYFGDLKNDSRAEAEKRLSLPSGEKRILFFGYIRKHKGLGSLIKAFNKIKKQIPDCRLVIAGKPEGGFGVYSNLIYDLGLHKDVILDLRYVPYPEMLDYFRSCDVVVLPYLKVCQSPIVQLAYSFGKPVITTEYSEGDVVEDGKSGYIVSAASQDGLTNALSDILSKKDRLKEMVDYTKHLYETKYSWKTFIKSTLAVYNS